MRKLTRKEIVAVSAMLGVFSFGAKQALACSAAQPCTLPPVTISQYECPSCEYIPLNISNYIYAPPFSPPGPSYVPGTVTSPGGTVPPFDPSKNPHCTTPGVDKTSIQDFIAPNEGNDTLVEAMTGSPKEYGYAYNNETGYVPWTGGWSNTVSGVTITCPLGPDCNSGFTTDGVDLSQWTSNALIANGAPSSLFGTAGVLTPFVLHQVCPHGTCTWDAPTGAKAMDMIAGDTSDGQNKLISTSNAQSLFNAAYNSILGNLQSHMGSVPFGQLPDGTQQAIMDYAWSQDGGSLSGTVASYITNMDWASLGTYLLGQKKLRLALDGAAILADIKSGKLPDKGGPC